MKFVEINEMIERYLPDDNLKTLIFEGDNEDSTFLQDEQDSIRYFSNLVVFITFVMYRIFIDTKLIFNQKTSSEKTEEINNFSNSLIRLFNFFNNFYIEKNMSVEVFEGAILNLEIDYKINSDNKGFIDWTKTRDFFNFQKDDNNLGNYFYELKKYRVSKRYKHSFTYEKFIGVLKRFPILTDMKVSFVDFYDQKYKKVQIDFVGNTYSPINLDDFILIVRDTNIYYLDGLEIDDPRQFNAKGRKDQAIITSYQPISNNRIIGKQANSYIKFALCDSEYYEPQYPQTVKIVGPTLVEDTMVKYNFIAIPAVQMPALFFKDYMFFNNKYIKYLSYIISDSLPLATKQEIRNRYYAKYGDIFNRLGFNFNFDNFNIRWDEIITFLLLEEGIYDFLKYLLSNNFIEYNAIMAEFKMRFGEKIDFLKSKYQAISNPISTLHLKNKLNKVSAYAKGIILLATKLLAEYDFDISTNYTPLAINDIIEDITDVCSHKTPRGCSISNVNKITYIFKKIINLNYFLVVFYKGILKYQLHNKLNEYSFALTDKNETLKYNKYFEFKKNCLNAFTEEVKKQNKKYNSEIDLLKIHTTDKNYLDMLKESVIKSFDELIEFNKSLSIRGSEQNELLFDVLGQRYLFLEEDIDKCKATFINWFNMMRQSFISNHSVDLVGDIALSYLEYLKDGRFEKTNKIEDAIYPVIGSYSNGVVSRDGYRYSYVKVNHGKDGNQESVKLVSEETLNFGESYYCVPNINRIANIPIDENNIERIWISPIIIPYDAVYPNTEAKFSNTINPSDYDKVSELIYYTDEKIYQNLFGNLENAKKVLPILFEDKKKMYNSLFYKDNIYVARVEDTNGESKVVAMAILYKVLPEWSPVIVKQAFYEAGIPLPETYEDANIYFTNAFSSAIGNNCLISDICVDPECRNLGYASFMINKLFKEAEKEGKNLILIVYEDNTKAFSLYNKLGFIPYATDADGRGHADEVNQEKFYWMIKLS